MLPHHHRFGPLPDDEEAMCRAIRLTQRRLLHVGCGRGLLGARLKQQVPTRQVYGVEPDRAAAAWASLHLDRVFTLDVERDELPLEPRSLDGILYGDVLGRLVDPAAVLRRHRRLLAPGGSVLCSVPNAQHHTLLRALLTHDFPAAAAGPHGEAPMHFFTHGGLVRLLLDCGYVPELATAQRDPCPPHLFAAALPLLRLFSAHLGRTRCHLDVCRFVFRGVPLPEDDAPASQVLPLSFVVCVTDEDIFQANLLRSPCLRPGSAHEVLAQRHCTSAAEGLNRGLAWARHPLVVCVRPEVYLPAGWDCRFAHAYRQVRQTLGPVDVAGVWGASRDGSTVRHAGRLVDGDRLRRGTVALPTLVDTLDDVLLALPRDSHLRFDPRLGWHLYGADACLQAREQRLSVVALDAPCFRNTQSAELPADFTDSAAAFVRKWRRHLPVATPDGLLEDNWTVPAARKAVG
jgi:SAM-dependent methyltransferase